VNGLGDRPEEVDDFRNELGGSTQFGDAIDDGAADDNPIGKGRNLAGLFGGGDAKAHTDRKRGRFFQEGDFLPQCGGKGLLHPCHALPGNVVDKARGGGDEGTNTGFGCGGGDENDPAEVAAGREVVCGLFGREIEKKETIGPGPDGGRFKLFTTESENRVVVGEKDEGDVALLFPQLGDELKNAGKSGAGLEGTLAPELVDDAVGQGIGKGNAQLDQIGTRLGEGGDEACGGGEIGISRDEIGDEGFALLFFETGKKVVDSVGETHPEYHGARDGRIFTRENRFRPRRIAGPSRPRGEGAGVPSHRESRQRR